MSKKILTPGPGHPISIEQARTRVTVNADGRSIADTTEALLLREVAYPPVLYIPRTDVDISRLQRTDHVTVCPCKGECNYYSIVDAGERGINAVWTYEAPYPAVIQIKDHLAFYRERVDSIDQMPM